MSDTIKALLIKLGFTFAIVGAAAVAVVMIIFIRQKGNSFSDKVEAQKDEIKKIYDDNSDWLNSHPKL